MYFSHRLFIVYFDAIGYWQGYMEDDSFRISGLSQLSPVSYSSPYTENMTKDCGYVVIPTSAWILSVFKIARLSLFLSIPGLYISTHVSSTQVVIICAYMQIVVEVVLTYICCTLFLSYFIIQVTHRIQKKQMIICFYFSTCRSVHSSYICVVVV